MKKLIMAMVLSLLFINVFAANDQIPRDRTITQINTYKDSDLVFIFISPSFTSTQTDCTGEHTRLVLYPSANFGPNVFSAALAAATAKNQTVGFGVSGCWENTSSGDKYPTIYRIDIDY